MKTGLSDCCGAKIIKGSICSECRDYCVETGEEEPDVVELMRQG